jgi:hypothetical protein
MDIIHALKGAKMSGLLDDRGVSITEVTEVTAGMRSPSNLCLHSRKSIHYNDGRIHGSHLDV